MESRTYKYTDNINQNNETSRSSRNARLYREVYGKYGELDNLPIQDNTDEIDMARLKELMSNSKKKEYPIRTFQEEPKRSNTLKEQKVYDINKLLEKAKYENNKLKEPSKETSHINREILETLESKELSLEEIKKECKKYESKDEVNKEDNLFMTREMKYHTKKISLDPLIEQVIPDNNNGLDLLEDLKPTGNTIVTKPIVEDDFYGKDTSDIDVIKTPIKKDNNIDDDFYTSSYKFSKKDFNDDEDDFFDEKPSSNVLKVILLLVAIITFAFVIYYFIANYGIGT